MLFNMILPGAVETARLPKEYQEVEYIQSSGTQYIDTGFVVNKSDNYTLEIDGLFPSQSQAYQGCNGYMQFYVSSVYGLSANSTKAVGNRDIVKIAYANQTAVLSVNAVQLESKSWASYNGTNVKLGVLRLGDPNNGWFSGGVASGRIYGYKVWKDEILVSECIPCLRNSDSAIGLYDIVREQFVGNAGTGVFDYHMTPVLPFGLKYTGGFNVQIVDGAKVVTLLSSGTLTVPRSVAAEMYMLAGGGGAALAYNDGYYMSYATGGGGGNETYSTTIEPGTYPIVVGAGGNSYKAASFSQAKAGDGGNTSAFGFTVTGGRGGTVGGRTMTPAQIIAGAAGSPNATAGTSGWTYNCSGYSGGSPNGGGITTTATSSEDDAFDYFQKVSAGGDGYVELTFR